VVAASGVIFGAAYMLWMFQRVVFGPVSSHAVSALTDMNAREIAYMAPLCVAIVGMGVFPQPFLDRINPSVDTFLTRMERVYGEGSPYAPVSGTPAWVEARAHASVAPAGTAHGAAADQGHAAPHDGAAHDGHAPSAAPAAHGEAAPVAQPAVDAAVDAPPPAADGAPGTEPAPSHSAPAEGGH
jgi:hypothetical protein